MESSRPSFVKIIAIVLATAGVSQPWGSVRADVFAGEPEPGAQDSSDPGLAESWRRPVFWSLLGGAAVAAGFGVYAFSERNQNIAAFNDARTPDGAPLCNTSHVDHGGLQCRTFNDRANGWRTTSFIFMGSSLALVGAAVVLKLTEPSSASPLGDKLSFGWTPDRGASASYRLRF